MGFLILRRPGKHSIGKPLLMWFIFCIIVALFAGYIASRTLASGTEHLQVFRIVSTSTFMGFAFGAPTVTGVLSMAMDAYSDCLSDRFARKPVMLIPMCVESPPIKINAGGRSAAADEDSLTPDTYS